MVVSRCWLAFGISIFSGKGHTFEELDITFERKVPTRQFKDYVI